MSPHSASDLSSMYIVEVGKFCMFIELLNTLMVALLEFRSVSD